MTRNGEGISVLLVGGVIGVYETGVDSDLELEENLFSRVNPGDVRREAARLAPEDEDLARIEATQEIGQQNLSAYLTEPYLDVYIATSMRERADFISVNTFVETLFSDPRIAPLHLRYFNPTLSWICPLNTSYAADQ